MLPSLLSWKSSPRLSNHSRVRASRLFSLIVVILLLTFSSLAFLYVSSDLYPALEYPQADPTPLSLYLLDLLVLGGGWLFMVLSLCFPVLRLTLWQVALILLGICLGVGISLHRVAYQKVCCMFGYNVGQGFPFAAVTFNLVSDTPLSWNQVYEIMRQHPDQISQQIAWPGLIADSMFFANLALIPVALVGVGLRVVKDLAHKAGQPHEQ